MADDALLEAVRGLRLAHPELGPKPLLAKLREQQPDLGAGNKEVREALTALKAESEATEAAAAAPPAAAAPSAAGEGGAPPNASLAPSLACFGCARLPSEMGDGREKHPCCPICVKMKLTTTYWCCVNCPANPAAWAVHHVVHKAVKSHWKQMEARGVTQQQNRETADQVVEDAEKSGDKYMELVGAGMKYRTDKDDLRNSSKAFREAVALRPDEPAAYFNLGALLCEEGRLWDAASRFLEAQERYSEGSEGWAAATASAFAALSQEVCAEVPKPEWWNDEALKALSARVVKAAPDHSQANQMRAELLNGQTVAWEAGPRTAVELKLAEHYEERAGALATSHEPTPRRRTIPANEDD